MAPNTIQKNPESKEALLKCPINFSLSILLRHRLAWKTDNFESAGRHLRHSYRDHKSSTL